MTNVNPEEPPRLTAEIGQPEPLRSGAVHPYSPAGEVALFGSLADAASDRAYPSTRRNARILALLILVPVGLSLLVAGVGAVVQAF